MPELPANGQSSVRASSMHFSLQSWRVLVMGLQRLSDKDMARRVPVSGLLSRFRLFELLKNRRK